MNPSCLPIVAPPSLDVLHARFLSILPRIELHGRISFRYVKCPHARDDRIADTISLAWKWFVELAERGKDATCFPTALASYAARAVRSGCRLCGQERANDVLSPLAQQRQHFAVSKLPDGETLSSNPLAEALAHNTQSPPDEAVCFKLDFTAWLASLTERDRGIAQDLMIGERTFAVADKYGVSPARISQLRSAFSEDWRTFCGEQPAPTVSSALGIA